MAIHIKSASVEQLARKVSKRTGETLTHAIGHALEERLRRLEAEDKKAEEKFLTKWRRITDRTAAEFRASGEARSGHQIIDELYDENGLPR